MGFNKMETWEGRMGWGRVDLLGDLLVGVLEGGGVDG